MRFHRLLFLVFCPTVPCLLTAIGCSKPILKMPKALPPIVKQYKHMTLTPAPGMRNTGIYLNKGDLYSILATGSIDMGPRGPGYRVVRPEHSWHSWRESERRLVISSHCFMPMLLRLMLHIQDTCT